MGAAERVIGGYIDHVDPVVVAQIVAGARELLAAETGECICPKRKVRTASSKRGRRYR